MKQSPIVAICLGVVLLGVSAIWPRLFPATMYWKQPQEDRLEEIQSKVHNLSYLVAQAQNNPDPRKNSMSGEKFAEYRELKAEAEELLKQRDNATARPGWFSAMFRWSGIAFVVLGMGAHFVLNSG